MLEPPTFRSLYQVSAARANPRLCSHLGGFTLVRVFTDEGLVGIGGQRSVFGRWGKYWAEYVNELVRPMLIEEIVEPWYVERFASEVEAEPPSFVSPRPACVEMALWDLIGKAAGLPVYKLFGAYQDRVKAYLSPWHEYPRWTADRWRDFAVKSLEEGFRAIKLKQANPVIERDLENVKAVRDGVERGAVVPVNQICTATKIPRTTFSHGK
jgi:galactonate dehydratase